MLQIAMRSYVFTAEMHISPQVFPLYWRSGFIFLRVSIMFVLRRAIGVSLHFLTDLP